MFGAWFGQWFGAWYGSGQPLEHSALLRLALDGTKQSRTVALDGVLEPSSLDGLLVRKDSGN